ncbi:unnamed protein product [Polarella glacialis]|uniref:RRM domain-containing protein n=1 Tax=Polarella glacialis TaxID=89957 RepID=A0A813E8E8_POLGL|nr:unnamed protein product [Polarella glacialis]CAE8629149.1 unnamed protein product [Polarella glacialis]
MAGAKGVELEVSEGITEHSSRVALKGVFQNFGDVVSCWIPPVDRRGLDAASVRFANTAAAEAAKVACDGGQVFLQGLPVKVNWRSGGGRRVGNSDLGKNATVGSPSPGRSRALAIMDTRDRGDRGGRDRDRGDRDRRDDRDRDRRGGDRGDRGERGGRDVRDRRSRSKDRRKRSRSKEKKRSRSRRRDKDKDKDKDKEKSRSKDRGQKEVPALPPPAPGAFSGIAPTGMPPAPAPAPALTMAAFGSQAAALAFPDSVALAAMAAAAAAPVVDPEVEKQKQEELKAARAERSKQLKRGPGVAALVQGALKRAQEAPSVPKKEDEVSKGGKETSGEKHVKSEKEERKRRKLEETEKADAEKMQAEEKKRKDQEAKLSLEKKKSEKEAGERRERAKRDAAEAEKVLEKKEAETRDQRVKASVEAAKKLQAAKKQQDAENLYGDMPQPNPEEAAATEAQMSKDAAVGTKASNLELPPEDQSKVVFLDVDGVLRPARAGTFDMASDADAAAKPDTSDFFPGALKALRHIIERTSAMVVLSSEWRRSETCLAALSGVFDKNRLRMWSSTTNQSKLGSGQDALRLFAERRAREISGWLDEHNDVNGWVVLDDVNLSIADEAKKASTKALGPHLVQTLPLCGLTMGNAKTAVRLLNGALINKVVVERPVAPSGGLAAGGK